MKYPNIPRTMMPDDLHGLAVEVYRVLSHRANHSNTPKTTKTGTPPLETVLYRGQCVAGYGDIAEEVGHIIGKAPARKTIMETVGKMEQAGFIRREQLFYDDRKTAAAGTRYTLLLETVSGPSYPHSETPKNTPPRKQGKVTGSDTQKSKETQGFQSDAETAQGNRVAHPNIDIQIVKDTFVSNPPLTDSIGGDNRGMAETKGDEVTGWHRAEPSPSKAITLPPDRGAESRATTPKQAPNRGTTGEIKRAGAWYTNPTPPKWYTGLGLDPDEWARRFAPLASERDRRISEDDMRVMLTECVRAGVDYLTMDTNLRGAFPRKETR